MRLSIEKARKIINLNPYPESNIIDPEVAERQFQVILTGFNYLIQPENNFLYIGDEVGLGKTYIALGIASLMRLYSNTPQFYTDTIIVPKQNLQFKWQKEIKNFISNNYLRKDNIVKSVLNEPVANIKDSIKHSLTVFKADRPQYLIYRNSSFSIASESDENSTVWIERLTAKLPEEQRPLFKRISRKFRRKPIIIKRSYALLLNHILPEISLLIVDEAHHFKHGVGNDVSIRNQIISRMFGTINNDPELGEFFPELLELSRPKVKKLLLLSATPINNSLNEIKNQLDCLLVKHKFSGLNNDESTEKIINDTLNEFMIRGVMILKINNESYSRNGYRHEHRNGNVEMLESSDYQLLKDNSTSLVLSLMQYKTIKELKLKSNNQFEMGMLAGFESFHKSPSRYEDDTVDNRKAKEAKDELILKSLTESYYQKFNDYPPHPKQESLVNELFKLLIKREKALVFVRRIASVRELERKLFKKYSDYLIEKIKRVTKGTNIASIKVLLRNYKEENIRDEIETVIDLLGERISNELKSVYYKKFDNENDIIKTICANIREINDSLIEIPEITKFKEEIKSHVRLKNIKKGLKGNAILLLKKKWDNQLVLDDEDEEDDENSVLEPKSDEERAPYFFQRFFYDEGKKFKNRSYKKDWYELNLLLFNDEFDVFTIDQKILSKEYIFFKEKVDYKRFQNITEITLQAIKSKKVSYANVKEEFRSNTFLTELLINLCREELTEWVIHHKKLISGNYYTRFLDELNTLTELIKSIFRQGSGIIPAFIAEAKTSKKTNPREEFITEMISLLTSEFGFVVEEIKQILRDYDKLVERNFDDVNKIRYNLIQQLPIAGISGHHKKDVHKTAIQFRMPGYPYILITTDILKEGEDLHTYCKNIYHYGIAWNPSDMEQRTGRIDRIDSMAFRLLRNIEGKDVNGIPFSNKLQVFYPYLADTLEVNQMIRLFNGMDKFIEIFYNDLSARIEKVSKANVDDVVLIIPEQRKGLLESKYEYTSFSFIPKGELLPDIECIGTCFNELLKKMKELLQSLSANKYFFIDPELDKERLAISGIMNVDGRQGPFKIYLKQTYTPGIFEFYMESVLGRVQVFGKLSNKEKTHELLDKAKANENLRFNLSESNKYVFVTLTLGFYSDTKTILEQLYVLIKTTDEIEKEIIQKDEIIELL